MLSPGDQLVALADPDSAERSVRRREAGDGRPVHLGFGVRGGALGRGHVRGGGRVGLEGEDVKGMNGDRELELDRRGEGGESREGAGGGHETGWKDGDVGDRADGVLVRPRDALSTFVDGAGRGQSRLTGREGGDGVDDGANEWMWRRTVATMANRRQRSSFLWSSSGC